MGADEAFNGGSDGLDEQSTVGEGLLCLKSCFTEVSSKFIPLVT